MDAESEGQAGLRVSLSHRSFRGLKAFFPVCQLITERQCATHGIEAPGLGKRTR